MTFASPFLLLSLLAIPVAIGAGTLLLRRRRMRYAVRFTNLELLAAVATDDRRWRRRVVPALVLFALSLLCVALGRPRVSRLVPTERATVILAVDASGSMQATDVKPSRLLAAEGAVRGFLGQVPRRLRVGLIVFAGTPQLAAPPTTDRKLVLASLAELAQFPDTGGTALGDALAAAVQLGERAIGGAGGQRTLAAVGAPDAADSRRHDLVSIVFLSDGAQTTGELQPLDGAARAKRAGFRVYTIALGTTGGTITAQDSALRGQAIAVPPDPDTLRAIARATGGEFFAATSAPKLRGAYSRLGSSLGWRHGRAEITFGFLAAAAGLLLAAGVLSARSSPSLP